jgi:predicted ATPase
LLTLTGVGGVGKTSVAIEVAPAVSGRYRDGVHFCELGHVLAVEALEGAVATMLGARPVAGMSLTDSIADRFRDRSALVILDNCEHIVEGVAQLAARIISTCTGVTLLTTSREPLRLPAEPVWALDLLAACDALP